MKMLEDIRWFVDSEEVIRGLINEWHPNDCKTENDYENSLFHFLSRRIDQAPIVRQYGYGRAKADIGVGDLALIEIKTNLRATSEYQRLIGQLNDYKRFSGKIYVVLTGNCDPELVKRIEKYAAEIGMDEWVPTIFSTNKINVLNK